MMRLRGSGTVRKMLENFALTVSMGKTLIPLLVS